MGYNLFYLFLTAIGGIALALGARLIDSLVGNSPDSLILHLKAFKTFQPYKTAIISGFMLWLTDLLLKASLPLWFCMLQMLVIAAMASLTYAILFRRSDFKDFLS